MRVLVAALAVPAFALGLAIAAGELMKGKAVAVAQPTSIVWADRVYVSKGDLSKWLRARGGDYEEWAAKHTEMAATLEGRPAPTSEQPAAKVGARGLSAQYAGESKRLGPAIGLITASVLGLFALTLMLCRRMTPLAFARARRAYSRRGPPSRPPDRRLRARTSFGDLIRSASTFHHTFAKIEERPRPSRNAHRQGGAGLETSALRESLRLNAPDLAFCLVSALLAVVIGISLALYLK